MRANTKIYHIDCFRCVICNKQLAPGDEYLIREDDLFCKLDSEIVEKQYSSSSSTTPTSMPSSLSNNNVSNANGSNNTANAINNNTCQNITNMQISQNNKVMIKCEDINLSQHQNEYNGS